jgi:hypothetical protein
MQATVKVVLSTGAPTRPLDPPAPARLVVSADLGHSFRAIPLDEQRRVIEAALTASLELALAKLDEANAPADEVAA